ncbi:hypothetical protein BELL_0980g00040 [Botrytis elliptica]|uniref:Uncharacterized protein n=1 Tax=Botrytis elliptica TaxID=278938 RepID=A0A4Z1J337_9HELO|nr:hypothetical protein BELL_0980g00040 [Botrytis elliptica]
MSNPVMSRKIFKTLSVYSWHNGCLILAQPFRRRHTTSTSFTSFDIRTLTTSEVYETSNAQSTVLITRAPVPANLDERYCPN